MFQRLHNPVNSSLPKFIQGWANIKTKFFYKQRITGDMNLFITTNIGTYRTHASVTVSAKEGQEYKENRTFRRNGGGPGGVGWTLARGSR